MVQKVTTMKSLVALLYLVTAAGTAFALPIDGNAEPCEEHDMAERSVLPREPGDFLMERSTDKREPDNFGNIVKREPDRFSNIIKKEPDRFDNIIKKEPDNFGNIVKREPDRFSNIVKKEP